MRMTKEQLCNLWVEAQHEYIAAEAALKEFEASIGDLPDAHGTDPAKWVRAVIVLEQDREQITEGLRRRANNIRSELVRRFTSAYESLDAAGKDEN